MADSRVQVEKYTKLGTVKIRQFINLVDPTDELRIRTREYLDQEKRTKHNAAISNAFELKEGEFTKFEFVKTTPAYVMAPNPNGYAFGMDATATIIYAKPKSVLFFQTEYAMRVKKACNPMNGSVLAAGGTNYTLDEIYFSKISSIQGTHVEKHFEVIRGCMGKPAPETEVIDGFKIRSSENFDVLSDDPNELAQARKLLASKLEAAS